MQKSVNRVHGLYRPQPASVYESIMDHGRWRPKGSLECSLSGTTGSGTSPLEQKHGEGIDAVLTEGFGDLHGGSKFLPWIAR
jgi:hypothetical protein